jgi:hypothetical protein
MVIKIRLLPAFMIGGLFFFPHSSPGAEPTPDMRDLARMYVSLEARDLKSYCAQMLTPTYAGYIGRVCEYSVKNRLKRAEDCTAENIAKQAKADEQECLAMKPAEFEEKIKRGVEGKAAFLKAMAEQGIDGARLLQEEELQRAKEQALREYEKHRAREVCCAKPVREGREARSK